MIYATEYRKDMENRGDLKVIDDNLWSNRCYICGEVHDVTVEGRHDWVLDHIVPVKKGGSDEPSNCAIVHHACNAIKSDLETSELVALAEKILKHHKYNS